MCVYMCVCMLLGVTLTCARLNAHWINSCQLQTGHELIWFFRHLGLSFMVAAVNASTGGIATEV